ncbi:hypothetical protein Leryth_009609 [Lithospermum erythrorhizon]|nr:hypothetical protein Leryth_009609 [Lithospermum erythrorhizon]
MGKDDELRNAKRGYKAAVEVGNRVEEARYANFIGNIFKNRAQYVEALKWLRIDYDLSIKFLDVHHQIPTCQSLGEVHFRLQNFSEALVFQKKHLELARDANNLVEQQRASTQLGRTYHEMFLSTNSDHCSVRNAKKYFKLSMELAEKLKRNLPSKGGTFVKEYVDACNNLGMLEIDIDNLESAQEILTKGLNICDEEEVDDNDDGRSRLHHNLGNVYMELRNWEEAMKHIEKDIIICHDIKHCQGEAKGFINLGELYYRNQKYSDANRCYEKALRLAKSMMDEDALVSQIEQNMETVKSAVEVHKELQNEEQKLKMLERKTEEARGSGTERKCLLLQNASLSLLIDKSRTILAWKELCRFAKKKEKIARELCDQEKVGDSLLDVGESYEKLKKFGTALEWYKKSWETFKSIGNLEGQALAKINIGDALDAVGEWEEALSAFQEGYEIARQANRPSTQLSALENMHYSHMIRFDNFEEARKLQKLIDELKSKQEEQATLVDCCYETESDNDDQSPEYRYDVSCSSRKSDSKSTKRKQFVGADRMSENVLIEHPRKGLAEFNTGNASETSITNRTESATKSLSRSTDSQISRKRTRVIFSDDEDDVEIMRPRVHAGPLEDVATSDEFRYRSTQCKPLTDFQQGSSPVDYGSFISPFSPLHNDGTCSHKGSSRNVDVLKSQDTPISYPDGLSNFNSGSNGCKMDAATSINLSPECKYSCLNLNASFDDCQTILFKIEGDVLHIKQDSFLVDDKLDLEQIYVEVACLIFIQLPVEKRSRGLAPILRHMTHRGEYLESLEAVKSLKDNVSRNDPVEVSVGAWVPKHLMKLYVDHCEELPEQPNLKVLKKLYSLEVSEDEVIITDCDLHDISVAPLLAALQAKMISVLNLSHNALGNGTMERLRQVFLSSGQNYGGLVLDLHSNRLGPSALFQICECSVLYTRLEVLNISGNRLTDSCSSYLSKIVQNCRALYSLNIENCSITSRTIQKVADSVDPESELTHLSIGHNNPISAIAITNLLLNLAKTKRVQELNLNGIKVSKSVVNSLCQLVETSCVSGLMLGGTGIGMEGASQLTKSLSNESQQPLKLDLSSCKLTSAYIAGLNAESALTSSILELNLEGNPIKREGIGALLSLLANPKSCLRVLVLSKCQLGLFGIVQILEALAENCSLEELNLSENACLDVNNTSSCNPISICEGTNSHELVDFRVSTDNVSAQEVKPCTQESNEVNLEVSQLEVADSEDEQALVDVADSSLNGKSSSISLKTDNPENNLFCQVSAAISMAKQLQLLDLSNNGISQPDAEMLYEAWSNSRAGITEKHIADNVVHLSVHGNKCCGFKPCCRRL